MMLSKRQYLILVGIIIIILLGLGIAAYFWRSDQLAYKPTERVIEAQEEWNELAIQDYTATVRYSSLPFDQIEYTLTVENGEIASAECVDVRREEPCESIERFPPENFTIDALFSTASELAKRHKGDTRFNIVFDPEYYYPQRFSIYTEDVEDSSESWSVLAFEELK